MKPRRLRTARLAKVRARAGRREAWRLQALVLADEREMDAIVRQLRAWRAYASTAPDDAQQRAAARIDDGQARRWTAAGDPAEPRTKEAR